MKANAPEKVYLEREKETDRIHHLWSRTPVVSSLYEHIEYTRTDVLIKKAETYFKEQFAKDISILAGGVVYINFETAINNFINYMKGE